MKSNGNSRLRMTQPTDSYRFPIVLRHPILITFLVTVLAGCAGDRGKGPQSRCIAIGSPSRTASGPAGKSDRHPAPATLDLREPMALAAGAIGRRLDSAEEYRPWFLLRGQGGIPATPEHASWDLGDMTGRYLEGLILTRRMGVGPQSRGIAIGSPVNRQEFSVAEGRLGRYLLKLLGPDGLVHDPQTGVVDHSFSQGSALYGLLAWFEDSGDPAIRRAIERLISGQLARMERQDSRLVDRTVKLEQACGSHLAGYQIWPVIHFYELTGYADARTLADGLTRWALADPVLGANGEITKALSWEGHIHSWFETLAGCVRTARDSSWPDREQIIDRCQAVYDWVQRTNATPFGWIATFPTHGSSETCAISSAIRLALELAASGRTEYLDDVERFVRNQVVEAQFRDLSAYTGGPVPPTPLLLGCFDSQSLPGGHLGTRGGEDVGTVEGCCLNGGMRALALAWNAIQTSDEAGLTVNFALSMSGPAGRVIGYEPFEGRVDIIPQAPGAVRVRLPRWAQPKDITVFIDNHAAPWTLENGYVVLAHVPAKARLCVRYPLRELTEDVVAGGQTYKVQWKGDTVVGVSPSCGREPTYRNRLKPAARPSLSTSDFAVPDTYELQDAARLATMSMLARMDLQRHGQPFFRIFPFANPPRAEHEKWDDGDMTGRYTEALIMARRMTGTPMDPRENILHAYLASLFDPADGLCYTQGTDWTPRRACLFSQSTAMLGLLAWHRQTGSPEARRLLDRHFKGLRRLAVDRGDWAYFPKYEFDGRQFVDEPKGKDAPPWYGGRLILPLVEYWQLSGRDDVRVFLEKLIRYVTQVSNFIKPDGEVERGEGWWGHLHGTMDMTAGIAEFGRLADRPELVAWARRVYEWIGRTHTTRYGWVADVSGGRICESCAIASRIRLGLALYRAGAADPFGEIDRHIRNHLLESQFVNLDFLAPLAPQTPRTGKTVFAGIDRMIRGTFQCWGTANDLIGNDDIEGCGAGGGVQGLALAWDAQSEWRNVPGGKELRVHLLFNRAVRGPAEAVRANDYSPLPGAPIAAQVWSWLPYEGRVCVIAYQPLARLALRLPDGADPSVTRVRRSGPGTSISHGSATVLEGQYVIISDISAGERTEFVFGLKEYETTETAAGVRYRAHWKGSTVVGLEPKGTRVPLYTHRASLQDSIAPLCPPRYPR